MTHNPPPLPPAPWSWPLFCALTSPAVGLVLLTVYHLAQA